MRADQRVDLARAYLTAARGRDVNYLRPSALLDEVVELRRHLGQVLAVVRDQAATLTEAQLATVLAALGDAASHREVAGHSDPGHGDDLDQAAVYRELAREIGGQQ